MHNSHRNDNILTEDTSNKRRNKPLYELGNKKSPHGNSAVQKHGGDLRVYAEARKAEREGADRESGTAEFGAEPCGKREFAERSGDAGGKIRKYAADHIAERAEENRERTDFEHCKRGARHRIRERAENFTG